MGFQTQPIKNFIGRGITFPFNLVHGRIPIETGFELLKASIINILTWQYGTRFMLNQFGAELDELLEEPNDMVLQTVIEHFVVEAISTWERRVDIVEVKMMRPRPEALHLYLTCRVKNSKDEFSFVFPFYEKIIY